MNIIGIVISVVLIILILNFIFKRFNILVDQTNLSSHKSFINGRKITLLTGGLVFFLTLIFFLPENYKYLNILIFFIFLIGLLSDLNILHSPTFRIIFQITIISVVLITLILNFVFTKFNILIDQTSISNHKSFINGHKTIPLSGGLVFFFNTDFFFT